jgi:hypothetical protein
VTDDRLAYLRSLIGARLEEADEEELAEALSDPDRAAGAWAEVVDAIFEVIEALEAKLDAIEQSLRRH